MPYTYQKLSEVTLTNSANDPNLLIEESGEIERIPLSNVVIPQVRVDWNESDANSAAFILNKPDLSSASSGGGVITYTIEASSLTLNGVATTAADVYEAWSNGSILRINEISRDGNIMKDGTVVGIHYQPSCDSPNMTICYFLGSGTTPNSISI